jgi:hypothetical protein
MDRLRKKQILYITVCVIVAVCGTVGALIFLLSRLSGM